MAVRAMPTQWVALGYDARGQRSAAPMVRQPDRGQACRRPPRSATGADLEGDAAVDAYLGWAADYELAVAAGMAVTISRRRPPGGATLAHGFARLVVCGVDWQGRLGDGRRQAQRTAGGPRGTATDSAILRPGTPTNNLSGSAGGRRPDRGHRPAVPVPALDRRVVGREQVQRFSDWRAPPPPAIRPSTSTLPGAADRTAGVSVRPRPRHLAGQRRATSPTSCCPLSSTASTLASLREHAARYLQPLGPAADPARRAPAARRAPGDGARVVASDDTIGNTLADGIRKLRPSGSARCRGSHA